MKFILVILLLFPCLLAFSQIKLTGKIVDYNNEAVEFAEIVLLNEDSEVVATELIEGDGLFSMTIGAGSYSLLIKQFNENIYTRNIEAFSDLNLGIIQTKFIVNLQEITIDAEKRIVSRKADRLVYDISNDALNKGSNLLEALHRAPRVHVENNNIRIIGREGNVKFLINGKIQNLSEEALKAKLKGLNVEQIERIEVIPTPPAKHSAEGNGGMIDIILKKDRNTGFLAGVNSGVAFRFKKISIDEGLNLNYNTKKLDATLNLNYDVYNGTNRNRAAYDFLHNTTKIESSPDFNAKSSLISTVIQYKVTSLLNIGTTFDYNTDNNKNNVFNMTWYYNKLLAENDSLMHSRNTDKNHSKSTAVSLFADYTLDSLGKKISLIYNHANNGITSDADNISDIYTGDNVKHAMYSNSGNNRYLINGLLFDSELPFTFGTIETGGAYTHINNKTSIAYYNEKNLLEFDKSNDFKYTEETLAAYVSMYKDWNQKWSAKLGLRIENTRHKGNSPAMLTTNFRNYTKLFPSLFIGYSLNDNHRFSLAYAKRIERPGFYDLNPFRYYTDTYSYISGNPDLLPTYTHSLEISYALKNNLYIIAYGNYKEDGIAYLTRVYKGNYYETMPSNNYTQKKGGLIVSYIIKTFKWNQVSSNFDLYYSYLNSDNYVKSSKGFGGNFSIRSRYELNKKGSTLLEVSYRQTLPSQAGFLDYKTRASGAFNLNFKQMFFNKDLILNLWISDVFRQNINKIEKQYDMYHYSQCNDIHNRGIYFSLSYSFGNKNVSGVYKDTRNENINRGRK